MNAGAPDRYARTAQYLAGLLPSRTVMCIVPTIEYGREVLEWLQLLPGAKRSGDAVACTGGRVQVCTYTTASAALEHHTLDHIVVVDDWHSTIPWPTINTAAIRSAAPICIPA